VTKSRKPNPIVLAVQDAVSELNDLLNAIGLRISLLQHQIEASAFEAEISRLAGLVEKASRRVQRLEEYARAEELVASMRSERTTRRAMKQGATGNAILAVHSPRTALLITSSPAGNGTIKECLERSGCKVVLAESSADGLRMLQSNQTFDHIVCDSTFLSETGWKFTAELSRAAPESRVYVLERFDSSVRVADSID
jgi:hypothetical protein